MIRITEHTESRLRDRGIERTWVFRAIASPGWVEPDPIPGRTRYYGVVPEFGGRVLKVVTEVEGDDRVVVTAHFDGAATRRRRRS